MCEYFQDGYQKLVIHKGVLRMCMYHIPGGGWDLLDSGQ